MLEDTTLAPQGQFADASIPGTTAVKHRAPDTRLLETGTANVRGKRISVQQRVAEFILLDCVLLILGGLLPLQIGAGSAGHASLVSGLPREAEVIFLALILFLASQKLLGGYRSRQIIDPSHTIQRLLLALCIAFSLLMMLGAAAKVTHDFSRLWFFSWMAASFAVLPSARLLALARVRRAIQQGDFVYRALSIGVLCDPLPPQEIERRSRGLSKALQPASVRSLDDIATLADDVRDGQIDEVYISVPWSLAPKLFHKLESLRHLSTNIYVVPSLSDVTMNFVGATKRGADLHIQMIGRPLQGWNSWLKRSSDLVVAAAALCVLWPLMAIIALAIVLGSRGPVFFRQPRQGFNGIVFEVLKFRSMYAESTDTDAKQQTSADDARVTRVGRFIRRTSLDELPQLFNVLQGHMSIVGPRPHALKTSAEGQLLADAVSEYAARHRVRPGMTGWAQVHGLRGELDSVEKLRQRVRYDIEYIDNWSIGFDVAIVLRTFWLLLCDPNAY